MTVLTRIGALDISEAIAEQIGSYVDMNFIQFLAAHDDTVHCWYINSGGKGPSFGIELRRVEGGWTIHLSEFAPGTEQTVEVP